MCDPDVSNRHGEEGTQRMPKSIGKIMNKIDDLEFKVQTMSTSENRSCELPYKSQVAPPRCRGVGRSQKRGTTRNSNQSQSYTS